MTSTSSQSASGSSLVDKEGLRLAIAQAQKGYAEGGIPIGSVILHHYDDDDPSRFRVLGSGSNQRIEKASPTLHGEMAALEDAGRQEASVYRKCTIYTTLSPCSMCTGAILLFKIPRVVIGENQTFLGDESLLKERGVEVVVVDDDECKQLMASFIDARPQDWFEDIALVKATT